MVVQSVSLPVVPLKVSHSRLRGRSPGLPGGEGESHCQVAVMMAGGSHVEELFSKRSGLGELVGDLQAPVLKIQLQVRDELLLRNMIDAVGIRGRARSNSRNNATGLSARVRRRIMITMPWCALEAARRTKSSRLHVKSAKGRGAAAPNVQEPASGEYPGIGAVVTIELNSRQEQAIREATIAGKFRSWRSSSIAHTTVCRFSSSRAPENLHQFRMRSPLRLPSGSAGD